MITLVPVGGLANRMKAIDAAVKLARTVNTRLRIIWFKDKGLNARFDELFQPIALPFVELKEASAIDMLLYDRPRCRNGYIPKLFEQIQFDACLYEAETTALFYKEFDFRAWCRNRNVYVASCVYFYDPKESDNRFDLFRPIEQLQCQIDKLRQSFAARTLGVHIRRTDNVGSITESPTELFIARMKQESEQTVFYLATDSESDKKQLKDLFGSRLITSSEKAERHSVSGMQRALVELYALAYTEGVIGSSRSSYSETAAQIKGIPFELIKWRQS